MLASKCERGLPGPMGPQGKEGPTWLQVLPGLRGEPGQNGKDRQPRHMGLAGQCININNFFKNLILN